MSTKGEHHTVPLSVLLKRESANEKIDNPELIHGQHNQSKKGEDFTLVKTECQRVMGDGVTTFSVFGVIICLLSLLIVVLSIFVVKTLKCVLQLFDGHNGSAAAIYTKENLLNNVLAAIPSDLNRDEWVAALPRALVAGFVKTDKDFQERARTSGTTVTFVIVEGWVVSVASVGDSRCILEPAEGGVYYLSADHRLEINEEERDRVTASGGEVGRLNTGGGTEIGPLRCWPGGLCLSRSIGDLDVGEYIVPVPYVKQVKLSSAGGRLIISSDGVWDAISAEEALDCCRGLPPESSAEHIVKEAVGKKGIRDDTTCIVVDILPLEKPAASVPPPKKQGKGMLKSMFKRKTSDSSSNIEKEYAEPDVVEELFEEGSAMLSERLDTKYPLCNMFKLFMCAVCQVEVKPGEGVSIHAGSDNCRKLRPWDGPFLCASCQDKKDAMEGKRSSGDRHSSESD
jgi:serine/threonine protein phosphatase PrpC